MEIPRHYSPKAWNKVGARGVCETAVGLDCYLVAMICWPQSETWIPSTTSQPLRPLSLQGKLASLAALGCFKPRSEVSICARGLLSKLLRTASNGMM
jgi:hypothetical protein